MKKVSVAQTVTINTARDLLQRAQEQARAMNEAILFHAISGVIQLRRIGPEHIKPIIGFIDGFTTLTLQLGDVTKQARKEALAKLSEDEEGEECDDCSENDGHVPAEKASGFDSRQYRCQLDQARAHLANAWTLLEQGQLAISDETPVPSVRGAIGVGGTRDAGGPPQRPPVSRH